MIVLVHALLIMLAIIVILGIIRVIITPSESFADLIMDIFFIDMLGDLLEAIFDSFD